RGGCPRRARARALPADPGLPPSEPAGSSRTAAAPSLAAPVPPVRSRLRRAGTPRARRPAANLSTARSRPRPAVVQRNLTRDLVQADRLSAALRSVLCLEHLHAQLLVTPDDPLCAIGRKVSVDELSHRCRPISERTRPV